MAWEREGGGYEGGRVISATLECITNSHHYCNVMCDTVAVSTGLCYIRALQYSRLFKHTYVHSSRGALGNVEFNPQIWLSCCILPYQNGSNGLKMCIPMHTVHTGIGNFTLLHSGDLPLSNV